VFSYVLLFPYFLSNVPIESCGPQGVLGEKGELAAQRLGGFASAIQAGYNISLRFLL
jgi:hypothetical protein